MLRHLLIWDLRRAFRRKGAVAQLLTFFIMVASLFPLTLGREAMLLQAIGGGVIWIAVLLSINLSPGGVFQEDMDSGMLEQWAAQPVSLPLLALFKAIAHWLCCGLPLVVLSPLIALLFEPPDAARLLRLAASLLCGTLILSLTTVLIAALTLGARRGGVLAPLLMLPLCVPVLIFGAGMAAGGERLAEGFSSLAGLFLLMLPLTLWGAALALRIALEDS